MVGEPSDVELRSSHDVQRFLLDAPGEWAEILSARAALRVLPLLSPVLAGRVHSDMILTLLRATASPWIAALAPERSKNIRTLRADAEASAAYAAAYDDVGRIAGAADDAVAAHDAAAAAQGAVGVIGATDAASRAARVAADAATAVRAVRPANPRISGYDMSGAQARSAIAWRALSSDARVLLSKGGAALAEAPLWPGRKPPLAIDENWQALVAATTRLDDAVEWRDVWLDWYEAVRDGRAPWDLPRAAGNRVLLEALLWPQREWDRGASYINSRILEAIGAERKNQTPPPEPDPGPGPILAPTPQGFETVPTKPSPDERSDPAQLSLHQAVLRRFARLDPEIARIKNTHRLLHDEYVDCGVFVSNDLVDIDVPAVWSTSGALIDMIGRLEGQFERAKASNRPSAFEELPDDLIISNLAQLARDLAAFLMGFEQGRQLAARATALRQLDLATGEQGLRVRAVLSPMLSTGGLLAERAGLMVRAIDRAFDIWDERTLHLLGAATAVATRGVVSFGRAIQPVLPYAVTVSALTGSPIDVAMKLTGDPNWETLRAAMLYLRENADALAIFASHDQILRRWLEWTIDQIKLHGDAIDA